MEWVETTGRTVEEALDAALDELGVDEHDVEFEVLARPRGRLLGRFGGEARIRARVKPISREKPGESRRRPRRQRAGNGRSSERGERAAAGTEEETTEPVAEAPRRSVTVTDARAGAGGGPRRRNRRRRGRRSGSGDRDPEQGGTVGEEQPEMPIDEQIERAVDFTKGLVGAFGAKAEVSSHFEDEDTVLLDVTGNNLGLLVGPRGATLAAIEELVRTVVQRQTGGHGVRVHVDVAGYRAKRREALAEFAHQLAE